MRHHIRLSAFAVALVLLFPSSAGAESSPVRDPETAEIVLDDLVHFGETLDALTGSAATANDSAAIIQELYLDRATPGLAAWIDNFGVDADGLVRTIARRPEFHASLRDLDDRIAELEPRIRKAYHRWLEIHPDAVFPPAYFFVGGLRAGGLAREVGLLIGADLYAGTPQTPLHEFDRPGRIRGVEGIPQLVSHELAHVQQFTAQGLDRYRALYRDGGRSLLGMVIREGSADFLADLTSGGHINVEAHAYGSRYEAVLWAEFAEEMNGADAGEWLFTPPDDAERPQDLGYYFGYRITEAFYRRSDDPAAAIQEILRVTDWTGFLERSGYGSGG